MWPDPKARVRREERIGRSREKTDTQVEVEVEGIFGMQAQEAGQTGPGGEGEFKDHQVRQ